MTPSVTERTAGVNGIDLHLAEAGPVDGPPVVLLHGFPDSWKLWRHQVDALAAAGYAGARPRPARLRPEDRPGRRSRPTSSAR